MSQGLLWLSIIIIGLLTLGIRLSFMLFMGKTQIVPMVQQALRFVPVAVLSALIAPALFLPGGRTEFITWEYPSHRWHCRDSRSLAHKKCPADHRHRHGLSAHLASICTTALKTVPKL